MERKRSFNLKESKEYLEKKGMRISLLILRREIKLKKLKAIKTSSKYLISKTSLNVFRFKQTLKSKVNSRAGLEFLGIGRMRTKKAQKVRIKEKGILKIPLVLGFQLKATINRARKHPLKPFKRYWHEAVAVVLLFALLAPSIFFYNPEQAEAATYTFFQTDWSVGATSSTAVHSSHQSGWDNYSTKDTLLDATSSSGQLTLTATTSSFIDTLNADFDLGVTSTTAISAGSVILGVESLAWSTSTIEGSNKVGYYSSIDAVDSNNLFISYYDSTDGNLRFASSSDGGVTWVTKTLDTTGYAGSSSSGVTSISAIDANNLFISYHDFENGHLKFASSSDGGANWVTKIADNSWAVGRFNSISAIDANNLFISYYGGADGLKFASSSDGGANWVTKIVEEGGVGSYNSISATDSNNLFISYYDNTNDDLKFASSSDGGANWVTKTVDATGDVGIYQTSISATDSNNLFISYYDNTNDDLKFASSSDGGSSWVTKTVDATGNVGYYSSISAIDSSNPLSS